jgi:ubiquitin-conjugating enzyme E2 J1
MCFSPTLMQPTSLSYFMHTRHFTIRGADGTEFEGGIYHGRILLPPEYPFKPPHIIFLTPSGRFETNTKICLSFSAYHPELWQPAWGIRLILEALISFLPTPASGPDGAIGALDWSSAERKRLAVQSRDFFCPLCGKVASLLPEITTIKAENGQAENGRTNTIRFQKEIEELKRLQMREHKTEEKNTDGTGTTDTKKTEDVVSTVRTEEEKDAKPKAIPTAGSSENMSATQLASIAVATAQSESDAIAESGRSEADVSASPAMPVVSEEHTEIVAEIPPQAGATPQREVKSFWLSDPVLQAIIVILSVICYLLLRKIMVLVDDLLALE